MDCKSDCQTRFARSHGTERQDNIPLTDTGLAERFADSTGLGAVLP